MKNLIIFAIFLITTGSFSTVQAQTFSGHQKTIERLEKKVKEQKEKGEAQKQKVKEAEKKVQDEIDRQKELAKKEGDSQIVNEALVRMREEVKKEKAQQEKEEKELKDLEEDLKKAKAKLEKKLQKAIEDILKKYPVPDNKKELDEYEKEMSELETNPRNEEAEKELRKRIKKRIDAKRKELEEHGALPGQQNSFDPDGTWRRYAVSHEETNSYWAAGIDFAIWPGNDDSYSDGYLDDVMDKVNGDPALFEKLFETLGGEFFPGSFSGPARIKNTNYRRPRAIGLIGEYGFDINFAVEATLAKGRSSSSADFPVTVINTEDGNTRQVTGSIDHESKYFAAALLIKYSFSKGWMRPQLGAGLAWQRQASSAVIATLGGEQWPVESIAARSGIHLRAQAGIQAHITKNISFAANLNAGLSERAVEMGAGVEFQYRFAN